MAPPKPGNAFAQQKELERIKKVMARRIAQQKKASEAAAEATRKAKLENQQAMSPPNSSSNAEQQQASRDATVYCGEEIQFVFAPPPGQRDDCPPTPQTTWNFEYSPTFDNGNQTTPENPGNTGKPTAGDDKNKDKSKYTSTESSVSGVVRPNALFYREPSRNKQGSSSRWECNTDATKKNHDIERKPLTGIDPAQGRETVNAATSSTATPQTGRKNEQFVLPSPETPLPKTTYKAPDYGRAPLPLHVISQSHRNAQLQQTLAYNPTGPGLPYRLKQPVDWYAQSYLYGINAPRDSLAPPTHNQITYCQRMPTQLSSSTTSQSFTTDESQYASPSTNNAVVFGNSNMIPTATGTYAFPGCAKHVRPLTVTSQAAQIEIASPPLVSPMMKSPVSSPGLRRSVSDSHLLLPSPCTARIDNVESLNSYATVEQVNEKIDLLLRLQAVERARQDKLIDKVDELLARKPYECKCQSNDEKKQQQQQQQQQKRGDEIIFDRGDLSTTWYSKGGASAL